MHLNFISHATGDQGFTAYEYERGDLMVRVERKTYHSLWTEEWFHALLPNRSFRTSFAAHAAAQALSPEQRAAERDRFPFVRRTWPDACLNRCRLCGARGHNRLALAVNWRPSRDWNATLCDGHWVRFKDQPKELLVALRARATRRAA